MSNTPTYTLAELADRFDLTLAGEGSAKVSGVGTLSDSTPEDITFLANRAYRDLLESTNAAAVILGESDAEHHAGTHLIAPDPYLAFARIAALFDHRTVPEAGVHDSAYIDPSATLGQNVSIGPSAYIGPGTTLGDHVVIGPCTVVTENVTVGACSRLMGNVTIGEGVQLGERVIVHPGAVIGADGFGLARGPEGWEKVPQLGTVIVGDDCEIGANSCIDRGAIGDTVLEQDVRVDNHVQIGHNCHIGAHTAMAAFTGISGSTRVGRNCLFAGRSGAHGHISIADGTTVSAMTMVQKDITEPGTVWAAGIPARPIREWHRALGHLRKLGRQRK